ncbi:hypothetical protein HUA74_05785 [Myxococcus sp. CA051A]|uniref:Uncharacterized protein n=1 Tax=Myxococcus llanfairpwllgwyngyllgogerychwyrndrobwllllantysiliogogogochensis TaxID=2590453 RepID=A0A540X3A8_9BACT|nr:MULTISPECIES: hypothetical protein [Myxococcus]NTX07445.1 hypothetical protein [Myxococcus sp. CA040A]NTX10892.1 hypothetical protein [Myxococcus sp. CA056]NTX37222.1 hypothetical protein [Myxococcus sp. CA033]NTX53111.1 hypothetical protein [Myxococcus sp. CA039A]NTX60164.1 hypothetical protein [Myxococcus sp. CA051A]
MSQVATSPAKTGTDLASLEQVVNLPRRPVSVQWRKAIRGKVGMGPTDWEVIAVLEYSEADAQALLATLTPTELAPPTLNDGGWLSATTRKSLERARAYDASAFYRPPLQNGTVLHVPSTNTFVLSLFTL